MRVVAVRNGWGNLASVLGISDRKQGGQVAPMSRAEIRIGGTEADYLLLTIHGRNSPDATGYWDGNFLWCTAEVVAGALRGSLSNVIRNEDLNRFLQRLETFARRLDGEALFDTLDDWLDVRLLSNDGGRIEVSGRLCDDPIRGNILEFRLTLDPTYLPRLIQQLRSALDEFPIVGQ